MAAKAQAKRKKKQQGATGSSEEGPSRSLTDIERMMYQMFYRMGHRDENKRYQAVHRGKNRQACRDAGKRWRAGNLEESRARARAWHQKNRERTKTRIKAKEDAMSPEQLRIYRLQPSVKYKYGISAEEYLKILARNNGMCEICNAVESRCVDHCHSTGKVRGALCTACNCGIGSLKDDQDLLRKAIKYLDKYQPKNNK